MADTIGQIDLDGNAYAIEYDSSGLRVHIGDRVATLTVHRRGRMLSLVHTEVPPPLRGRGVGGALADAVLRYAEGHGLTVKPYCPFIAGYITRHPHYRRLIDPEFPA